MELLFKYYCLLIWIHFEGKPVSICTEELYLKLNIPEQITHQMAFGNAWEAFGLSATALRPSSPSLKTEIRKKTFKALQKAIQSKIKELRKRIKPDLKFVEKSLELFQQATAVTKYFRKGSSILHNLTDLFVFKERNLKRMKRNSLGSQIQSIFRFHSVVLEYNDTVQNRMELLKDVRKYMLHICTDSLLNSFLVALFISTVSQIVNISVVTVEAEKESVKIVRFPGINTFSLKVSGKLLKQKFCLAVAQFSRDLLGNTNESRLTQIYEVEVIKNEKFYKSSKNEPASLIMTFHVKEPPKSGIDCMTWTKHKGWNIKCSLKTVTDRGITCYCDNFGYFSAFFRYPSAKGRLSPKTTTALAFTPPPAWTAKSSDVIATVGEWDSCASFKIYGDYNSTVGKDSKVFSDDLKQQIVRELKIPSKAISYLFIRPGSILVTVFFVDVHNTKAESIVKVLVKGLHTGDFILTAPNTTQLTVDPHHLQILVSPPITKTSSNIRFVAYAILAVMTLLISTIAIAMAILEKKKSQLPLKAFSLSTKSPYYRQFRDESFMSGSSVIFAVHRT